MVTPTHIIVANCGDSRSILVRANAAVEMSFDHKPYNDGEHARIVQAGGSVTMRRVNGDLAGASVAGAAAASAAAAEALLRLLRGRLNTRPSR